MKTDLIIAGFGGQGLLFAGKVLACAAMLEERHLTWLPSYGPEMRGGTASCAVIISDRPVSSPLVRNPTGVIALNQPSLDKFAPVMLAGGVLVANSTLTRGQPLRTDIGFYGVPASQVAERLGAIRVANLVALGAYVGVTGVVTQESIEAALARMIPDSRANLRALNLAAFQEGKRSIAKEV